MSDAASRLADSESRWEDLPKPMLLHEPMWIIPMPLCLGETILALLNGPDDALCDATLAGYGGA